jgi:hypothetical protein
MNRITRTGWITSLALAASLSAPSALAETPISQRLTTALGSTVGQVIADQGNRALIQIRQEVKEAWPWKAQLPDPAFGTDDTGADSREAPEPTRAD